MSDVVASLGTILGVWAHPDDEVFSSGGLLYTAVQNGQKVVCITATRGEGGVQDEERWPAAELGSIRTDELKAVYDLLGIEHHEYLDFPDGACAQVSADEAAARIAKTIDLIKPDTILTFGPDGLTGHPDHQAVSEWVRLAVALSSSKPKVYHIVITNQQFAVMQLLDASLNMFFNIDKPPVVDESQCSLVYKLGESQIAKKLECLSLMPSQYDSMLSQFKDQLAAPFGVEAFVNAN